MQITLKAARVNAAMTQKEAAEKLGIPQRTLWNYEKGKSFPNVPMIVKIENLYGVKYEDIIFLPNDSVKREEDTVKA